MKYTETLSPFQTLLLLRCFRVDRVYRAVTDYISVTMDEKWEFFWNSEDYRASRGLQQKYYRKLRSFFVLSAQVCAATCYQLWCYSWAEHTFLPHHIYPEPWFWPNQWPSEISREVWIWREVPVPCYGPRPREGNPWHSYARSVGVKWTECRNP